MALPLMLLLAAAAALQWPHVRQIAKTGITISALAAPPLPAWNWPHIARLAFPPPTAAMLRTRYRQALEFALTPPSMGAQRTLPAIANCRIVTESHICRAPETDADAGLAQDLLHH